MHWRSCKKGDSQQKEAKAIWRLWVQFDAKAKAVQQIKIPWQDNIEENLQGLICLFVSEKEQKLCFAEQQDAQPSSASEPAVKVHNMLAFALQN